MYKFFLYFTKEKQMNAIALPLMFVISNMMSHLLEDCNKRGHHITTGSNSKQIGLNFFLKKVVGESIQFFFALLRGVPFHGT
jgi:hypothetical protein